MDRDAKQWHESLKPPGMEKVRPLRKCQRCNSRNNKYMSKLHGLKVCMHCVVTERVELKRNPGKVLAGILGLMVVLLAGCAAPREANIKVHVAGQSVVMNFRK
jgi:hypothetical protein